MLKKCVMVLVIILLVSSSLAQKQASTKTEARAFAANLAKQDPQDFRSHPKKGRDYWMDTVNDCLVVKAIKRTKESVYTFYKNTAEGWQPYGMARYDAQGLITGEVYRSDCDIYVKRLKADSWRTYEFKESTTGETNDGIAGHEKWPWSVTTAPLPPTASAKSKKTSGIKTGVFLLIGVHND
jgi:hypothetical protein